MEELRKTNQERSVVWEATVLPYNYFNYREFYFDYNTTHEQRVAGTSRLFISHGENPRGTHTITVGSTITHEVRVREGKAVKKNTVRGFSLKNLNDGHGLMVTAFQRGHGSAQGGRRGNRRRAIGARYDPFGLMWWVDGNDRLANLEDVLLSACDCIGKPASSLLEAVLPMVHQCGKKLDEMSGHKYLRYSSPNAVAERFFHQKNRAFIRTLANAIQANRSHVFETMAECFKGLVPVELLADEIQRVIETPGQYMGTRRSVNAKGSKGYPGVRYLLKQYSPTIRRRLLRSINVEDWSFFLDLPSFMPETIPARPQGIIQLHDGIFGERNRRYRYLTPAKTPEELERERLAAIERKKKPLDGGNLAALLKKNATYGEYTIHVPETVGELEEMGEQYHNCMGGYADWRGGEVIGTISKNGERCAAFQTLQGRLAQFLGISNDQGWALLPELWAFQDHLVKISGKPTWWYTNESDQYFWGPNNQSYWQDPARVKLSRMNDEFDRL